MGGGTGAVPGHWVRGVLQHGGRGGPGPVGPQDRRPRHLHRPRQLGATRSGQPFAL